MKPLQLKDPSIKKKSDKIKSDDHFNKNPVQLIWGVALFVMGIGVIFRVPVVAERILTAGELSSGLYFLRFCFYLIAVILMGGGIKKITKYWPSSSRKNNPMNND
ncbi:MAG: hypothetical protein C4518_02080 [Desulfobacteraceae bacterium]|nr:MAG: hypothetical protein C4518_02080 [Desulfobacteraceae bacterium]